MNTPARQTRSRLPTVFIRGLVTGSAVVLSIAFLARFETAPLIPGLAVIDSSRLELGLSEILFGLSGAALLAVSIRVSRRRSGWYWWGLTGLFALLFVTKASGAFWRVEASLRSLDDSAGWFGWQRSSLVLVATQVTLGALVGLVFLRWVVTLPRSVKWRMLVSGILFVSGAVGAEAVSEWVWSVHGPASVQYVVSDSLETVLETTGLIVFVDGLLRQFILAGQHDNKPREGECRSTITT
jgi:hypothetical protein